MATTLPTLFLSHGAPTLAVAENDMGAAESAFRAADRGDARFEVSVAKVRVGEAAGIGAGIAHQSHGAIGFTYEHSLHFVTRRVWSWRAEFGAESHWAAQIGREVASRGGEGLWPHVTGR
jgi:acyl-CoA dehydrogenase